MIPWSKIYSLLVSLPLFPSIMKTLQMTFLRKQQNLWQNNVRSLSKIISVLQRGFHKFLSITINKFISRIVGSYQFWSKCACVYLKDPLYKQMQFKIYENQLNLVHSLSLTLTLTPNSPSQPLTSLTAKLMKLFFVRALLWK